MERNLVRVISFFSKSDERFVGEHRLDGIDLATLQAMFGVPADDPMSGGFPVGPAGATALRRYVPEETDLLRYDYFVECYTTPAGPAPASEARAASTGH